jgi:hypothetical protein
LVVNGAWSLLPDARASPLLEQQKTAWDAVL